MDYRDTTAVVTGAGSGIGRALAIELARRGANIAASDIDVEGLGRTASLSSGLTGTIEPYELDVADREAVIAHVDHVTDRFGSVEMVFNNAGVAVGASVLDMSWDDLDWLLGINLMGVINGSKAFLPQLVASGRGRLVNISSIFGLVGVPSQSAYCTAKFGVRGFTETLRQEMLIEGHPVSVHCVHPGGIRTNIVRNGRMSALGAESGPGGADDPVERFERSARHSPERAAEVILRGVERDKPRILIGREAYFVAGVPRVLGGRYQNVIARLARRRGAAS